MSEQQPHLGCTVVTAEAWSAISPAEPRTELAKISTTAVEPRTLIFLLLFQEKRGRQEAQRSYSWGNPLSRVFCQSSLASSLETSVSYVGRGGPWRGVEPGTNLSPVTGSVLLRVSRSMMESNGTFRKNTLRGRTSTMVSWREPQAALVRDQGGQQPPGVGGASVAITQARGIRLWTVTWERCRRGLPAEEALRTLIQGRCPAPITSGGRGDSMGGGNHSGELRGADAPSLWQDSVFSGVTQTWVRISPPPWTC